MATPKDSPTMVSLHDGRVLVLGGPNLGEGLSGCKRSVELYDPATNAWTRAASMHHGRCSATAVVLPGGQVLVAGGAGHHARRSAEVYHPVVDRWSVIEPMRAPRTGALGALLPNGRVLVAGGAYGETRARSAEMYNPISGHWRRTDPMLPAIDPKVGAYLRHGGVMVIGCNDARDAHLRLSERYLPRQHRWLPAGRYRVDNRCGMKAILAERSGHGQVMVVEGRQAHRYGPSRKTWRRTAPLPLAVGALPIQSLTWVDRRPLLLAIRISCDPVYGVGRGYLWRPKLHHWERWTTMPTAFSGFTALPLHDGSILLAGGPGSPSAACGGPAAVPTHHAVRFYPHP